MIGDSWVVCMRITSERPKTFADGSTGWLHPVGDAPKPPPEREREPVTLDVAGILESWSKRKIGVGPLATDLGVSVSSLLDLGCIKSLYYDTWAFPMFTGERTYCGIRLRRNNGDKWAERGSHSGLFWPESEPQPTVLITEGPTDTAAALTLGYWALGRPSCAGGIPLLQVALKRIHARRAVIVADLDDAGLRGARTLQEHLPIGSAILALPAKDLRSAVRAGITSEILDCMISQLLWTGV